MSGFSQGSGVDFSNLQFYGRQEQLDLLQNAFINTLHQPSPSDDAPLVEVALVHGVCGTGKSMLIQKFCQDLNENGVCVVEGCFERHMDAVPYSGMSTAISNLSSLIAKSEHRESIVYKFQERTRPEERNLLVKSIPALQEIIFTDTATVTNPDNSFKRLQVVLRDFFRIVCSYIQPVVMILEDLQFADAASLEMIRTLITDFQVGHFLFIGSFRDDDAGESAQQLDFFLHSLTHQVVNVHDIELLDFSQEVITSLITDVTRLEAFEAESLAEIVHKATAGNVLFVVHLLRLMAQRGYIYYSDQSQRWEWSKYSNRIEDMIQSDISDVVADEVRQLPLAAQEALKIASCLGSHFQLHMLAQMIYSIGDVDLDDYLISDSYKLVLNHKDIVECHRFLTQAVGLGLIHESKGARYRFHDRVIEAAYSMIPDGSDKLEIHFKMGKLFYKMSKSSGGTEWMLLAAVIQLNRGSKLIMDRIMKTRLAELNLEAAKIGIRTLAFAEAAEYLTQGLSLLDKDERWESNYDLALELSSTLAEIAYIARDFVLSKHMVDEVVKNACSMPDKYQVYQTLVRSLSAQGRVDDAFDVGLKLLALLGEKVRPSPVRTTWNLLRLKSTVLSHTDENLMNLPPMQNEKKKQAVIILRVLIVLAWVSQRTDELRQMQFRLTKLTMDYGTTPYSAASFAYFGMALNSMGSFNDGYRMGKISMEMARRNGGDALAVAIAQCFLVHSKQPLRDSAAPLLQAYHSSIATGFVESSFMCAYVYICTCFEAGAPLSSLVSEMKKLLHQVDHYGYSNSVVSFELKPLLQTALNISGEAKNALKLKGEILEEKSFLEECTGLGYFHPIDSVYYCHVYLSTLFGGDVQECNQRTLKLRADAPMKNGSHARVAHYQFVIALTDINLYRTTGSKRLLRQAEKILKLLEKFVDEGDNNIKHLHLMLLAELECIKCSAEVKERFDDAIAACQEVKYVHREAITNERAALFFLEQGKVALATEYMVRAKGLYQQWGAGAKVSQVLEKYAFLFYDTTTLKLSRSKRNIDSSNSNSLGSLGNWMTGD
jgi:predicted ATPase